MASNSPTKTASSLPIIAILAILGGAYYASQSQLKSSRPEAPVGLTHAVSEKDKIEARLWQDPLKVACEHEKTMHGTEKGKDSSYGRKIDPTPWLNHERAKHSENKDEDKSYALRSSAEHSLGQIHDRIDFTRGPMLQKRQNIKQTLHILLTMVRDGISAEDHERRLRNRYAMVTALHSSGLVPEDSKHIRYFRLPWMERNDLVENLPHAQRCVPRIEEYGNSSLAPLIVPYEWFKKEEVYLSRISDTGEDDRPEQVLLVWLPESAFSHRPLTRLAQVIDALGYTPDSGIRIDMIGPSHSGTLRTMLTETREIYMNEGQLADYNCVDINLMLKDLTIFSPWSTASPALLVKGWSFQDPNQDSLSQMYEVIPNQFKKIGVTFVRMIGSDDLLAMELINELARRGVDIFPKNKGGKGHHLALISEWDTFYGNAFPLTFATMMESIEADIGLPYSWRDYTINLNLRKQSRDSNFPGNLHTYSYIRGIDGRLPESKSSKEERTNEKSEDNSKLTFTKGLELPTGRSQLDYIRRLTQKLSDKYKYFGNNKLKAIGVVGSDVYDKLVLLQALREQFSDMIIFTIDIDARMMHHEQLKWTRNVIVASNFGLELSDSFQGGIYEHRAGSLSPFRDNYQTSLFLACLTALTPRGHSSKLHRGMSREELTEIISHPRLFEIGRGRAVNLTVSGKGTKELSGIHPPHRRWPGLKAFVTQMVLILVAIVFCILLVVLISPSAKEIVPLMSLKRWDRDSIGIKLLVLAVIGFIGVVIYDHYREGGEPFSLDAGVSIWPGEILRLIAVIVGAFLLVRLVNKLEKSEERLCEKFSLDQLGPETEQQHENFRKRLKSHFSWKRMEGYCGWVFFLGWTPKVETDVNAQQLWNDYQVEGKWRYRFLRSVPMALAYMVLSGAVIYIFGLPNTPFRGNISFKVNQYILMLSGIYMVILIFFVVDATYLCLGRLTGPLIKLHTVWPDDAMEDFKRDSDIEPKEFAELLDVRFVTNLTEDIGKMIYWPFIVLAVMVAARFPYFDNWNFPISLIITYALPSIYLIVCAIKLQRTAKRVRAKALDYLNERLFASRFGQDENRKRALKLTRLIREIESVHEGAFRPFFENPVIHVILGSGGAGLLALMKYMPLS